MKKFARILLFVAFGVLSAGDALTAEGKNAHGLYFTARAGLGVSMVDDLDFDIYGDSYTLDAEEDSDTSSLFGLAIGWDLSRTTSTPVRIELEFMNMGEATFKWQKDLVVGGTSYDERFNGKINATTFFLNGYYDFHNSSRFTPFVQAGLGIANVKLKAAWYDNGFYSGEESDTNTNLAVNVGGGVGLGITDNFSLDAAYRFNYLGPAGVEADAIDLEIETTLWRHDFLLGARYTF